MIGGRKTYVNTFTSAETAARVYDQMTIYLNGLGAKTNFAYTRDEVLTILDHIETQLNSQTSYQVTPTSWLVTLR